MARERLDILVAERGARKVSRDINRIGASATAAGGATKLLRRSLGLLGGALAIGGIVRTLADFSQAMSTAKAITEATDEQFKALRDTAKELGATTRFSATDAAEGMTFLARAGFDANQTIQAIGPTLTLAQAGALGLAEAADIASNVLKGFRLEAENTQQVVDVLAKTANSSNTNVQQLGDALSFVAPAAAAVGVSVEQAAAAVGVLSDAGIQGSRAGTALRAILIKLIKPTAAGAAALKSMGLTAADVNVEARGLQPVLETLRKANIGLSEASDLVGQRQASSLLVLKEGTESMNKLTEANENAAGTSQRVADVMDDNLNGALFAVKSAFEAVIIAMGDLGVESFLTKGFRALAGALRFVASNMDDVAAAAKILGVAFLAMKIPVITAQVKRLTLALLANPIGLLVGSLVGAIALLTIFRDKIALSADGLVTLGDAMEGASNVMGTTLTDAINGLGFEFEDAGAIFDKFVENLGRGLVVVLATANGVARALGAAFQKFPLVLKAIAFKAFNGFLDIMEFHLNIFSRTINAFFASLGIDKTVSLFDFDRLKFDGTGAGVLLGNAFKAGFDDVIEGSIAASVERRAAEAAAEAAKAAGGGQLGEGAGVLAAPGGGGGGGATSAFQELLDGLRTENELLLLGNQERQVRTALLSAEESLERKLTSTEAGLIRTATERNIALTRQDQLLQDIKGSMENHNLNVEALNALLQRGAISQEEFNKKLKEMNSVILSESKTALDGLQRGLLSIQDEMTDLASTTEELVTGTFGKLQDQFKEFRKTGQFEISELTSFIADKFIELGTKQLFTAAFGNFDIAKLFSGGGGNPLSFLPGFAHGGGGTLGGRSGIDANTLSLNGAPIARVSRGEELSIAPRGQQQQMVSRGPVTINFNIKSNDPEGMARNVPRFTARALKAAEISAERNQ